MYSPAVMLLPLGGLSSDDVATREDEEGTPECAEEDKEDEEDDAGRFELVFF